jgi:hypothetical protein
MLSLYDISYNGSMFSQKEIKKTLLFKATENETVVSQKLCRCPVKLFNFLSKILHGLTSKSKKQINEEDFT